MKSPTDRALTDDQRREAADALRAIQDKGYKPDPGYFVAGFRAARYGDGIPEIRHPDWATGWRGRKPRRRRHSRPSKKSRLDLTNKTG